MHEQPNIAKAGNGSLLIGTSYQFGWAYLSISALVITQTLSLIGLQINIASTGQCSLCPSIILSKSNAIFMC